MLSGPSWLEGVVIRVARLVVCAVVLRCRSGRQGQCTTLQSSATGIAFPLETLVVNEISLNVLSASKAHQISCWLGRLLGPRA